MRTSRQFSERVEQQFQRRPNRFRRWLGWLSLVGSMTLLAVILVVTVSGESRIYQAGPVAKSHQFIENDCAKCHNTWGPVSRLISFHGQVSSVSEAKCQVCHLGPAHHLQSDASIASVDQNHGHSGLGCAVCHRDHRHDDTLLKFADLQCVQCHRNLKTHGGSQQFVENIESFGEPNAPDAHPEFAIQRFLADPHARPISQSAKKLLSEVSSSTASNSAPAPPGDVSKIQFNHEKHLRKGLLGPKGELLDLSQNCAKCHEPDDGFRRMKPISYEKHCQECHVLSVGIKRTGPLAEREASWEDQIVVPHQDVPVVLGFLTQQYTLRALAGQEKSPPKALPDRPLPGQTERPPVDEEAARRIKEAIGEAEKVMNSSLHSLYGREAHGCGYCHNLRWQPTDSSEPSRIEIQNANSLRIVPPNIPQRWMEHANFSHDSHRLLNCQDCHRDFSKDPKGLPVTRSQLTSDVLMPTIEVCRKCHANSPASPVGLAHLKTIQSAGTKCTLCHNYHDRSWERQHFGEKPPETTGDSTSK